MTAEIANVPARQQRGLTEWLLDGMRPLLLTIMALVHYNDGQLPEERVGLYSRCVDLLLGQTKWRCSVA